MWVYPPLGSLQPGVQLVILTGQEHDRLRCTRHGFSITILIVPGRCIAICKKKKEVAVPVSTAP